MTATMCSANVPIRQLIRGHYGAVVLGNGEEFTGYDFVAERPEVTHDRSYKDERVEVGGVPNTSLAHFTNFVDAVLAGDPGKVNCSPMLGAAAMVIVKLGSRSYREGKVFHFDVASMRIGDGSDAWATGWEKMSHVRELPKHVAGWHATDTGSTLIPKPYQSLGGPWIGGVDPAAKT